MMGPFNRVQVDNPCQDIPELSVLENSLSILISPQITVRGGRSVQLVLVHRRPSQSQIVAKGKIVVGSNPDDVGVHAKGDEQQCHGSSAKKY